MCGQTNRVVYSPLSNFIMGNSKSSCVTAVLQLMWSLQLHQPEKANVCVCVCVCVCVTVRKSWDDDDNDDDGKVVLWFRGGVDK